MNRYQIIVSNLGAVLDRESESEPVREYHEWVRETRAGHAECESVVLLRDGEPIREHVATGDL